MEYGTLYGVGVGPGAPDLMTLRSVNILKSVDVIAIPRRSEKDESLAWKIAKDNVGDVEGQERLFFNFPMVKDPEVLRPAWEIALSGIGERLKEGKSVAFITEGDPFVYSTFIYLFDEAKKRWPEVNVKIVPAVTSITAVAAVAGIPLADGAERVAILPATYGVDDVAEIVDKFDTTILMKVGKTLPQTIEALEREGCAEKAYYVSRATMEGEKIVHDLNEIEGGKRDYFSMIVVSRRERSGALSGKTKP
ncbi:Cobalt-precorrin-2 C20-methyltransferase [hydrothermal vent metagenome]|uniref:Cobalt-precorrin-2 C20-methyltransferase n=1 Tax=hydrothermal vent metagenome TaxID=652676 RepID=A0A3B1C0Q5_9ZZZZ